MFQKHCSGTKNRRYQSCLETWHQARTPSVEKKQLVMLDLNRSKKDHHYPMSKLKYSLNDFIATVPSCQETTTLADVLEIFDRQCDRLVVLKEQTPIGLLTSARLITHLLTVKSEKNLPLLDLQQPLSASDILIEPIEKLSASLDIEQFGLFLRGKEPQTNINLNWALIDSESKFLGLVDPQRLWQFLREEKLPARTQKEHPVVNAGAYTPYSPLPWLEGQCQPLIQLLERLPWPLMLQTSNGEVVTQNPAWWQQLGALKDPEGVRQQVEAILAIASERHSRYSTPDQRVMRKENPLSIFTSQVQDYSSFSTSTQTVNKQQQLEAVASSRCSLDSQLGTCTCVVQIQNGQERIWRFAKIPLNSPELRMLTTSDTAFTNLQSEHSTDLWLILATDVTEQQQLCKELAAKNADLIQLNRLKDEFLACISHELKTPLTAVLGLSRLLVDGQIGELNERQARYAGLIHQSGRHLMSVVNDILDLTRMETGQMELTLTHAKISAVCDRALKEAKAMHAQSSKVPLHSQQQAETLQHKFSLSIEPGLDEIVADELRLRQMLVHLLSNAFKFTETGGEIGLRVSRWEGWIAFTVWDTGIGIPEHQQHLIFQKFQQLENPLTRQFEGTGLGLVLTRALARLHGGDVSFLSREGKGSQFTLLLPPSPPKTGFGEEKTWGQEIDQGKSQSLKSSFHASKPGHLTPALSSDRYGRHKHTTQAGKAFGQSPLGERGAVAVNQKTSRQVVQKETIKNSGARNCLANASPQEACATPHHPTSSQRLVLVVEAVSRYIEQLTEQLTGLGYRVVIARSGCEAVEKARRLQPKAIFLNPLLPMLSGWDVLTLLKSDAATHHIPVIVTATAAEKEQVFANSADGFLSLPVQHSFLRPLVEKLFATPEAKQHETNGAGKTPTNTPLRILRLVNQDSQVVQQPLLPEHRVIEVDDFDQAELLTRVWQFDVVLLDGEIKQPQAYLQQLRRRSCLAAIPLVTCDVETTQTASQMTGLSVFPCLTAPSTLR